jgi:hypothetical protein
MSNTFTVLVYLFLFKKSKSNCSAIDSNEGPNLRRLLSLSVLAAAAVSAVIVLSQYVSPRDPRGWLGYKYLLYSPALLLIQEQ